MFCFFVADIGTCAITAIPFEKSKVLFTLEELDDFSFVDETDHQGIPDVTRIGPSQEKWGWIMFECGIENLTIKGRATIQSVIFTVHIISSANNLPSTFLFLQGADNQVLFYTAHLEIWVNLQPQIGVDCLHPTILQILQLGVVIIPMCLRKISPVIKQVLLQIFMQILFQMSR